MYYMCRIYDMSTDSMYLSLVADSNFIFFRKKKLIANTSYKNCASERPISLFFTRMESTACN